MSDIRNPPETLPVTVASLIEDFRNLGVQPGMTLLVHTSMRSIGWVSGGPVAVVLALEEALGPEGTLVMPAHTSD
ncbi:AAC(3) family N-acetyltransferase, partial [Escherichia coli]|uniref:AAC(3) family N-acetyltransferase n=1 Tax=Escherichia coli TaxID=562 RepID=UPI00215B1F01